ncbi:MAG TPA: c-type cytochrome [Acidobacteriota bacterium]|nr:c-type cytochrome [Acidobacteriota bacterium]
MSSEFCQRFSRLVLLASVTALLASCQSAATYSQTDQAAGPVERGRYLVTVAACNDCHTPLVMGPQGPEPDMSRTLSGHPQDLPLGPPPLLEQGWMWGGAASNTAFFGPWGVTYAANLTPDENTGLGIWSEEMFLEALRTGRHMGQSRPIQPPMPWPSYSQMREDDLKAIYAYLRSLPAIHNRVPEYQPPTSTAPDQDAAGASSGQ